MNIYVFRWARCDMATRAVSLLLSLFLSIACVRVNNNGNKKSFKCSNHLLNFTAIHSSQFSLLSLTFSSLILIICIQKPFLWACVCMFVSFHLAGVSSEVCEMSRFLGYFLPQKWSPFLPVSSNLIFFNFTFLPCACFSFFYMNLLACFRCVYVYQMS